MPGEGSTSGWCRALEKASPVMAVSGPPTVQGDPAARLAVGESGQLQEQEA